MSDIKVTEKEFGLWSHDYDCGLIKPSGYDGEFNYSSMSYDGIAPDEIGIPIMAITKISPVRDDIKEKSIIDIAVLTVVNGAILGSHVERGKVPCKHAKMSIIVDTAIADEIRKLYPEMYYAMYGRPKSE